MKERRRKGEREGRDGARLAYPDDIGGLSALVAVEDVDPLAPDEGCQLARRRLAAPRVPHQQHGLGVLQAALHESEHAAHAPRPHDAPQGPHHVLARHRLRYPLLHLLLRATVQGQQSGTTPSAE